MHLDITLKNLGLDQKERQVYLKLLELGEASMTNIARATQIKRATAYLVVEELQIKGLVSETMMGKRKQYSAIHPRRLVEMARSQKRQIEDSLPDLVALYNQPKNKPRIQVFEHKAGMRMVYKDIFNAIERGAEALFFANVDAIYNEMPEIVDEFNRSIADLKKIKIRELHYKNKGAKKWMEKFKKKVKKGYQVRHLSNEFEFGFTDNVIYENKLVTQRSHFLYCD